VTRSRSSSNRSTAGAIGQGALRLHGNLRFRELAFQVVVLDWTFRSPA
jgi:hypothetical protein